MNPLMDQEPIYGIKKIKFENMFGRTISASWTQSGSSQTPLVRDVGPTTSLTAEMLPKTSLSAEMLFDYKDRRIDKLEENLSKMRQEMRELKEKVARTVPSKIHCLPSEKFEFKGPVDIIIKVYADEVLALLPELELYGEGGNEMEAITDLKLEIVDLLEDFEDNPDEELGEIPILWKKTLDSLVKKCQ